MNFSWRLPQVMQQAIRETLQICSPFNVRETLNKYQTL